MLVASDDKVHVAVLDAHVDDTKVVALQDRVQGLPERVVRASPPKLADAVFMALTVVNSRARQHRRTALASSRTAVCAEISGSGKTVAIAAPNASSGCITGSVPTAGRERVTALWTVPVARGARSL